MRDCAGLEGRIDIRTPEIGATPCWSRLDRVADGTSPLTVPLLKMLSISLLVVSVRHGVVPWWRGIGALERTHSWSPCGCITVKVPHSCAAPEVAGKR
jgi:hypothetical protein